MLFQLSTGARDGLAGLRGFSGLVVAGFAIVGIAVGSALIAPNSAFAQVGGTGGNGGVFSGGPAGTGGAGAAFNASGQNGGNFGGGISGGGGGGGGNQSPSNSGLAGGLGGNGDAASDNGGNGGAGGTSPVSVIGGSPVSFVGVTAVGFSGGAGGSVTGLGGGGGGGVGGYGVLLGGSANLTLQGFGSTVTGGSGGTGGSSSGGGRGGNGGDGGAGIGIVGSNVTLTISPGVSITGGTGGLGGISDAGNGTNGAAGAGILVGAGGGVSGVVINNSGKILGATAAAPAINILNDSSVTLTSGNATSGLTGNIAVNGFLTLAQTANSTTIANTITDGTGGNGGVGINTSGGFSVTLSGANTYSGGTFLNSGTLVIGNNSALGTGNLAMLSGTTLGSNGSFAITNPIQMSGASFFAPAASTTLTLGGAISDGTSPGFLVATGPGNLILSAANSYTGGTTVTNGTLQISGHGTLGATTGTLGVSGGTLDLGNTTQTTGALTLIGGTIQNGTLNSSSFGVQAGTVTAILGGTGALTKTGSGTVTLDGANTYSGGTFLNTGSLFIDNSSALGTGNVTMQAGTTLAPSVGVLEIKLATFFALLGDPTFAPAAGSTLILSGVIANGSSPGTLDKTGAGTLVLAGNNTYTGPTNVNAGTLDVTGSIANSSSVNVAKGATLTGTGTFGNLAFQSGAIYMVQVTPSSATSVSTAGSATLTGATVNAQFASGSYVAKQYTILTAAKGLGGTTFAGLTNTNLPAGASDSLSYSANTVFLNLTPGFANLTGLNVNQQNVANALTNYFNTTGSLPAAFLGLTPAGLTQIDGEVATGGEVVAFQLMDQFLNLMLDPFVDGRLGSGVGGVSGRAMGFAPDEQATLPPDVALAYAGVLKAPPQTFEQRWTAWGASYGGGNWTSGNAATGSSNVSAQTYGFAGGLDYHYSPDTIFGFALGGGGTAWGLASGLGAGRSDAFQTGVYGITRSGPAYLSAALAFANHWMTTNRSAAGDGLTANFDAQSYAARVEGGYRFAALPALGVTPYAALQAQDFHTPSYSETNVVGGGFGLSYAAMNATDIRTELGTRFDNPEVIGGMPLLLRARVAWAHDFVSDPSLSAAFQSLPGTNFVVNGAPLPQNSALTSAGAELFITPRLTLLAKFDGEFAPGSQTYAGSGTLRYMW